MISLHKRTKTLIPILLLTHYIFVCLAVSFLHNHAIDIHFHDNCQACQWDIQARDNDTVTVFIWHIILNPLAYQWIHLEASQSLQPKSIPAENNSPRAPPN